MAKNKASLEKDKKKKIPYSVLTKKGLMGLAMAGVMVTSPFILAGCSDGQDGKDGTPGTIWKSGTSYTEFTDAKVGDYFIDTDDYILYQKTADSWTVVMENYGKPGTPGAQGNPGNPGDPGKDGNTWTVDTVYPANPNVGDMFLNSSTWEVYQYNEWDLLQKVAVSG